MWRPAGAVEVAEVYDGPARLGFMARARPHGGRRHHCADRCRTWPACTPAPDRCGAPRSQAHEIPSLDEVPILAVAAAVAAGTTVFHDVGELRVKEVDRLAAVVEMVEAFGARATVEGDTLSVTGRGGPLRGARFDSRGDHRMAMAAAVAGAGRRPGERTLVTGFRAVETSYPAFADDLRSLTEPATGRPRPLLIAIDGPAGAGKSTVSSAVAAPARPRTARYGRHVPRRRRPRPGPGRGPRRCTPAVAALAEAADHRGRARASAIDGRDVTDVIRSPEVGRAVSVVAANPRRAGRQLVLRQRAWAAAHGGGVVEGRDIGSVVFPDAELKVFLTASPEERARRRHDEAPEGVARRDRLDSTRAASPLVEADDARRLDTTGRSVEDVIEEVLVVAVSASEPAPDGPSRAPRPTAAAPGRHQPFEIDPRRTPLYRAERVAFESLLWTWFRPKVTGREHIPATGPVILAPVHRSFADFGFAAFCTDRKLFFMTKDEMWKNKYLGKLLLTVGAFPVHRESADREALQRAEEVLRQGEVLVLFPEGTRRAGPVIEDLMEGRRSSRPAPVRPIVPIGIGGSDLAMPKGSTIPKPLHHPTGDRPRGSGASSDRGWARLPLGRPRRHRAARGADPGRLRRGPQAHGPLLIRALTRTGRSGVRGLLAHLPPGFGDHPAVAEAEEPVLALLGRARGPGQPHRRALGHPPAPAHGDDRAARPSGTAAAPGGRRCRRASTPAGRGSRSTCR